MNEPDPTPVEASRKKIVTKDAVRLARRAGAAGPVEKSPPTGAGPVLPEEAEVFWPEARVAAWLGLPRRRVARMRRTGMREGRHWSVAKDGVIYNKAGLERALEMAMETRPARANLAAATPQPPAGPLRREKMRVIKTYPNRRLMLAERPGSTSTKPSAALVRVRDNQNFIAGMRIEAVFDDRSGAWQYTGRMPRRKGRL